ncbi:MAG: hypothetical protein UZ03_NOB001001452 [Nitrospira sp. OLB3]|nr:MAG: hypothetical protein UZ03_NOB001001452 [Nitrospira sp. OLB3]
MRAEWTGLFGGNCVSFGNMSCVAKHRIEGNFPHLQQIRIDIPFINKKTLALVFTFKYSPKILEIQSVIAGLSYVLR